MKIRKFLSLALALILVLSVFAGCGAASNDMAYDAPAADAPAAAPMEGATTESAVLTDSAQNSSSILPTDRKLITTVRMDAETEDLDAMLAHITGKVASLGGYMESQEIYNGSAYASRRYRNANLTIRIPAENLNQFITLVSDNCNIVSKYEESDDVTMTYVSIESRIAALEVEQDRLLELLGKAENMEDLLTIESRLTDVRYELEEITSQLRVMDNRVNYSTIHLYLNEVTEYTEVVEPETFGERVGNGFMKSLGNLWDGIVEVVIFLLTRLPYLLLIGAIVVVVVILVKKPGKKGQKTKKQPPKPIQTDDPQ